MGELTDAVRRMLELKDEEIAKLRAEMKELLAGISQGMAVIEEKNALLLQNSELRALLDREGMTRAGFQGELMAANRLNRDMQQLFSEVATMFELTTRQDIDGLLRARIQEALAGVAVKPKIDGNHHHNKETCDHYMCREAMGLEHLTTCTCIVCERKRRNDGLQIGEVRNLPYPKPINENQPAFIQTPMGFGCRNCGRPPGGAGGCLICQRY